MNFMGKMRQLLPNIGLDQAAISYAKSELQEVRKRYASQIDRLPRAGHLRGVDYYSPRNLTFAVARGAELFRHANGFLPSLCNPKSYNEKLFWMKFFGDIPQPSPGNKLAVGNFIPREVSHLVTPVRPVWISNSISLPDNEEVPPGHYFFKANYGSGYLSRVEFPLVASERSKVLSLAHRWPHRSDVEGTGEWWYHTYAKEYFLEQSVSGAASPEEFQFAVLNGQVGFVQHIRNRFEDYKRNLYGPEFQPLELNIDDTAQGEIIPVPECYATMRQVAEAIGRQFSYSRIDLFLLENAELKLNEITLCPGNCTGVLDSAAKDREFADMASDLTFVRG